MDNNSKPINGCNYSTEDVLVRKWKEDLLYYPAIHGLETIYRNDECNGIVRRANYGYSINKPLLYGYIYNNDDRITKEYLENGNYQIEIMGKKYPLTYESKPLFDNKNNRIKGIY